MKQYDWNKGLTRKDYAFSYVYAVTLVVAASGFMFGIAYWDDMKTWVSNKIKNFKNKKS